MKLIKNILLFFAPIAFLGLPPFLILYFSYESFRSIKDIIKTNNKYIIGFNYSEHNYHFIKLYNIDIFPKRDLITLGSSRILQFRSNMFNCSFYNAGYTIHEISNLLGFMQKVKSDKYPKYLLLSVDQSQFKKVSIKNSIHNDEKVSFKYTTDEKLTPNFITYKDVYVDVLFKNNINKIINSKNEYLYGLKGKLEHSGFRNDGSFSYDLVINKLLNNPTQEIKKWQQSASDRMKNENETIFGWGDTVNNTSVKILDSFLHFCNINNIMVIGFAPPYASFALEKMKSSGNNNYFNLIDSCLYPVFSKYNFEFYNFTDLNSCNATDSNMLDGMHGSEVVYQNILLSMLKQKSVLNRFCDSNKIKTDLDHKLNRYTVYDY